jgi:hypothetical protein
MPGRLLLNFFPGAVMRRSARFEGMQCWVDFFEESYFGGKMHREFGEKAEADLNEPPGKARVAEKPSKEKFTGKGSPKAHKKVTKANLPTGSLIVGPAAKLELRIQRDGREIVHKLKPCQLIPDIAGSILRGGKIQSMMVRQIVAG